MLIRKITRADNRRVAEIIRTVMTEFGAVGDGFSIQDAEVDAMFEAYATDRSVFYVLEEESRVLGCGGLGPLSGAEPHVCELKKMYFLPELRGRGLGELLCETLQMDARRMSYDLIYVETLQHMSAANWLYQKMGFEKISDPMGNTGHCGCDTYYVLELPTQEIDPSLLV